ncbi:MAG TPA: hypothetical protein VN658_00540 [Candidatus Acidoferrales bacterium]|nr:hypothetical protein [Candidatus Acidoferrales bacterium]
MKTAAIGVSVHSGWGAVVAIAGAQGKEEVLLRRRLVIIDSKMSGAAQPYHYVVKKEIHTAETYLNRCVAESGQLAFKSFTRISAELHEEGFMLKAAVVLLSSARPLPNLEAILSSHALIHTAEGEFFRQVFRGAFEQMNIPVTGIRTCDLNGRALKTFAKVAPDIQKRIDGMGRSLGPPWTKDEKVAALAAAIVLAAEHSKNHAIHVSCE